MKKFQIVTEYDENELRCIVEQTIYKVLHQELERIIPATRSSSTGVNGTGTKWLTRKEVKELLKISLPTIAKLHRSGQLKAKLVGGSYRYSENEVQRYLNNN